MDVAPVNMDHTCCAGVGHHKNSDESTVCRFLSCYLSLLLKFVSTVALLLHGGREAAQDTDRFLHVVPITGVSVKLSGTLVFNRSTRR